VRSSLFGGNVERTEDAPAGMSLQNPRLLKVRLAGDVLARQGAMVAYQGQVQFAYEGAGGVGRFLKKALTGEGVPLMRCTGRGDLFLAHDACPSTSTAVAPPEEPPAACSAETRWRSCPLAQPRNRVSQAAASRKSASDVPGRTTGVVPSARG